DLLLRVPRLLAVAGRRLLRRAWLGTVPGGRGRALRERRLTAEVLAELLRGRLLGLARRLGRMHGRALLGLAERADDDGGAVGADLAEGLRDVAGVEPHADDGVRAALLRLPHHPRHHLLAGGVDELSVLLDLAAPDRPEARDEVLADVGAADGHPHHLAEHGVDAVSGDLVGGHDDHGRHPCTRPPGAAGTRRSKVWQRLRGARAVPLACPR